MGQYNKDINLNNTSKIRNLPTATADGHPVEYRQYVDALATKLATSVIAATINADAGKLPDAPTVKAYVDAEITALINGAPGTLDTLKEIADWTVAHEDVYDALVVTVAGKIAQSSITSDITTASTGEVPDAAALYTYIQSIGLTDNAKIKKMPVDFVANTPLLIQHDLNTARSEIVVTVKDPSGEQFFLDISQNAGDTLNSFYLESNQDITTAKVILVY